ncbi:MAG: energy transducer TonB [Myxococcota bacterium]
MESEPEPSPEPEIEVRPRPAPRRAAAEPEPAASTEPPAPAEPIAFDQVMTGGAGSFSVPVGEGVERSGRVRPTRRVVREEPVPTGSPTGTGVVPLADLSERPQQPAGIRGRLQANYPTNARAQGIAGRASVRLRVQPNGAVRVIQVLNASAPEFGEACRRSLEGHGRWQPGRDDGGRAVATVVRFNCDFTVGG